MDLEEIKVKQISKRRFDALVTESRSPQLPMIGKELSWHADESDTILGVVLFDKSDKDFASVLLARDEGNRYRTMDVDSGFASPADAEGWVERKIRWHIGQGVVTYPQGDSGPSIDLFEALVPREKLHPSFIQLADWQSLAAAKKMVSAMMPHFKDVDGNFAKDFQTTGFDARVWELYLYSCFIEGGFHLDRNYSAPDYCISKGGRDLCVEAVIVGRDPKKPKQLLTPGIPELTIEEMMIKIRDELPIKFGSPLYSKMKKKYWELAHVAGKPFILAIADFHDEQSMVWSAPGVIRLSIWSQAGTPLRKGWNPSCYACRSRGAQGRE